MAEAEISPRLEVAALDLGAEIRSVGLELIDPETREPVQGAEAARIWAAVVPALAGDEPVVLDFFAHLDRVRAFCQEHSVAFAEPNPRVLFIPQPSPAQLESIFERFAAETFGIRAGSAVLSADPTLENGLASRGVDGYHATYPNYFFCAVCDFEGGFLTILSNHLWASEVIRRARPAVKELRVEVDRPSAV